MLGLISFHFYLNYVNQSSRRRGNVTSASIIIFFSIKKMIKAIVLDLDGVYYKRAGLWPFHLYLVDTFGKEKEEKINEIFSSDTFRKEFQSGKISETEFWEYFELTIGEKVNKEEIEQKMAEGFVRDEPLLEYVSYLKKEYSILFGICSNTNMITTKSRLLNDNFPVNYDFQVLSHIVKYKKPQKEIFEIVIDKAGCRAEEIVYADDNPKTLPEAKELGINTHVYKDFARFKSYVEKLL